MRQACLVEAGRVEIQEVRRPEPAEGEVLLAPERVGVCGSDVHVWHDAHPFTTLPVVQGHEYSATVVEAGPGVEGWEPGTRVVVEPSLVCRHLRPDEEPCPQCRAGRYNICDHLRVMGFQAPGCYAEYVAVPADRLVRAPDDMDPEVAAFAEPVSVGIHACRRVGVEPGARVLVVGAGTIGLLLAQSAKALGAGDVAAADIRTSRLELAGRLGIDHTVQSQAHTLRDAVRQVWPDGPDVVFEVVGAEAAIRDAVDAARKGTRIGVVGVFGEDPRVQMGLVQDRELELIGTLMYMKEDWEDAVRFLAEGAVEVRPLVTHRFDMAHLAEAYRTIESDPEGTLKVMIEVERDA